MQKGESEKGKKEQLFQKQQGFTKNCILGEP
jgi:hypothetical protein